MGKISQYYRIVTFLPIPTPRKQAWKKDKTTMSEEKRQGANAIRGAETGREKIKRDKKYKKRHMRQVNERN